MEAPTHPGTEKDASMSILHGSTVPYPVTTTTEFFHDFLKDHPEVAKKVAIVADETSVTFESLDATSTKLAQAIRSVIDGKNLKNVNPDQDWVIALCLPPSEKLIISIFAIHKLGGAYVPIDTTFPQARIVSMVDSCRPALIISDDVASTITKFDVVKSQTEVLTVNELVTRAEKLELSSVVPLESVQASLADRVAIVLYTSGSSGAPKGVRLTHSAIMNRLSWQWQEFPFTEDEQCCFKTSLTFVDSVAEIFGPLLQGHKINVFSKLIVSNPNLLIKKIHAVGITRLVLVPSLLRALLSTLQLSDNSKEGQRLNTIRLWVCSGETLQEDLLNDFFAKFSAGTTLANFYGSTEVMADVTVEKFASADDVKRQIDGIHVPIGSPIFNTILYVLDENLKPVEFGTIGELYVAGRNLSAGYVGIANGDKFIENTFSRTPGFERLFKTGDFVRAAVLNGRTSLLYEGRSDSQVKVRGQRVDMNEIEAVLNNQSDLISRVFVLCYHAGHEDQAIVAFTIPAVPEVTTTKIKARAKETLKPYEIPEIRIISEVPLLVNGKVDRQRLLLRFQQERDSISEGVTELTFTDVASELIGQARALVKAVSEVTHVPEQTLAEGLTESFFNVGGTSLNSITVVTKLRANGFYIALDDFIKSGSLKSMLSKISAQTANLTSSSDVRDSDYFTEFLLDSDCEEASGIIAHSFSTKGDLEVYTNASYGDFKGFITTLFPTIVEKGFSFIVRRKSDKRAIATSLNFDFADEPDDVVAPYGIQTVLDFLEHLESRQREKLPKGSNKIIHSFMMGTHESVAVAENVPLVTFMEQEVSRVAKDRGFVGVMTTNTNPLTMQICSELLGYETLTEYQVNLYKAPDGSKPFKLAPNSQTVNCCWKRLEIEERIPFPK